jgi:alkylation response protein AidB-like acyl-CoA dehydrogenase
MPDSFRDSYRSLMDAGVAPARPARRTRRDPGAALALLVSRRANIFHLVLARPEGHGPGTKGLSMFLVPKYLVDSNGKLGEHNGARVTNLEHKMGLRASTTCEITFGTEEAAVGTLVGGVHDGIRQT